MYSIPLAASQPIDANKLYRIMVTQSATGSDLTFKLVVADWTDTDNLPTFEEGSVEAGFNPVVSSSQGVSISGDNNVDYSDATGAASVQLYYVSATSTKPTITSIEPLNGTHAEAINVGISEPVAMTYAGTAGYMSTVTITLHKTTVPVDLRVNLAGTTGDSRTVNVISVPDYTDPRYEIEAGIKPVLFKGTYYAPLNVGATTLTLPQDGKFPNTAYAGLEFQWGRNVGFRLEDFATWSANAFAGPVSLEDAEGQYADRFIKVANVNWQSAPISNALWSDDRAQGPCPQGWRVPTSAENLRLLTNQVAANVVPAIGSTANVARAIWLAGDVEGQRLYLPATGYVDLNGSSVLAMKSVGVFASYWTATANASNDVMAYFALIQTGGGTPGKTIVSERKSWGLPVRCIQQ
jgi:uncharacterized protein (TIGR02145 family)